MGNVAWFSLIVLVSGVLKKNCCWFGCDGRKSSLVYCLISGLVIAQIKFLQDGNFDLAVLQFKVILWVQVTVDQI